MSPTLVSLDSDPGKPIKALRTLKQLEPARVCWGALFAVVTPDPVRWNRAMHFSRNALLSCQILAARKLRTLLSMTGVVVGVGAVILMVSVGRGAEKRILERIGKLGTNLVVVNAAPARLMIGRQRSAATVTTLMAADAYAIGEECPHVIAAAPAVGKSLVVRWESSNTTTAVTGMAAGGFLIRNIPFASGRPFDADEDRTRRRVAVIGPTVVKNIFGASDPVGQQIRIGRVPFEVIGLYPALRASRLEPIQALKSE